MFFSFHPLFYTDGMHGVKRQKPGERDEAKEAVMRARALSAPPRLARNFQS